MSEIDPMDGHRSWEEIVHIARSMQDSRGPQLERMRQIELRYDGTYTVPLPQRPDEPDNMSMHPSLMGELIDGMSQRASAVPFQVGVPAVRPHIARSVKSADARRDAINAVYFESKFDLVRRSYYRHLTAYHSFALLVIPDWKKKMPRVEHRSPLTTFAEPRSTGEMRTPAYTAFITTRSSEYVRRHYPAACAEHGGCVPETASGVTQEWNLLEWFDDTHRRYGLLGPAWDPETSSGASAETAMRNLVGSMSPTGRKISNMALTNPLPHHFGMCPVVAPELPSLGRIAARLSSLIGMIDTASQLSALDIEAQLKAVFPDTYIIGDGSEAPAIEGGQWKDGVEGGVNVVKHAKEIGVLRTQPDSRTGTTIDRLERNFRASSGLTGQMTGENNSSLRTGRAIDALGAASLDPRIAEMHAMTTAWIPHIQEIIIRGFKEYWPKRTHMLYTGQLAQRGQTKFVPSVDCDDPNYRSSASYSVPGADMIQLTQVLGSLAGANAISQDTFRELHPFVTSPDEERNHIFAERIEQSILQSLMQRAEQGQLPLDALRLVLDELKKSGDVSKAVEIVEQKLREIQAAQAPPPEEGQIAAPETMPGLEGGPAANQQPTVPGPGEVQVPEGVERLRQLQAAMGGR